MKKNKQGVFIESGKIIVKVNPEMARSSKYKEEYANLINVVRKYGIESSAFNFELECLNQLLGAKESMEENEKKESESVTNGVSINEAVQYFRHQEMVAIAWSTVYLIGVPIVCIFLGICITWLTQCTTAYARGLDWSSSCDSAPITLANTPITLVNIILVLAPIVTVTIGWPIAASMGFYYNVLKKKVAGDRSHRILMYAVMVLFVSRIGAIAVHLNTDKLTPEDILKKVKTK